MKAWKVSDIRREGLETQKYQNPPQNKKHTQTCVTKICSQPRKTAETCHQALGAQAFARHLAKPKLKQKDKSVIIATLNLITLVALGERQEIDKWLDREKIDILTMQETEITISLPKTHIKYTWFFSGQDRLETKV